MAVFLLEIRASRQVHPVQYLFVGLTMIFFYVLLLSLAEQIGFLCGLSHRRGGDRRIAVPVRLAGAGEP